MVHILGVQFFENWRYTGSGSGLPLGTQLPVCVTNTSELEETYPKTHNPDSRSSGNKHDFRCILDSRTSSYRRAVIGLHKRDASRECPGHTGFRPADAQASLRRDPAFMHKR